MNIYNVIKLTCVKIISILTFIGIIFNVFIAAVVYWVINVFATKSNITVQPFKSNSLEVTIFNNSLNLYTHII